jgi:hypothetical protein
MFVQDKAKIYAARWSKSVQFKSVNTQNAEQNAANPAYTARNKSIYINFYA